MFRHKSLGLLSGMLIAPRMAARLASKAPGMLEGNSSAQHMLGQATHGLMYAFMIAMPVRAYGGRAEGLEYAVKSIYTYFLSYRVYSYLSDVWWMWQATGIAMGYYGGKGLPFFWYAQHPHTHPHTHRASSCD